MDRFDEMRTKGINTNDATASASDILKDKTAYVKGKKVVGTLESGGGSSGNGFLPLPASQLKFTQKLTDNGKGTIDFIYPDEADKVELLIKEDDLPENVNDYTQKYVFTDGNSHEIEFTSKEDGTFENKYGMWLIPENEFGKQTALNNTNRKLIKLLRSKGRVKELEYTNENINSYSFWSSLYCGYKIDEYVFISSTQQNYRGVLMLDLNNNEIYEVVKLNDSTSMYNVNSGIRLNENKILITNTTYSGANYEGTWVVDLKTHTSEKIINNSGNTSRSVESFIETENYIYCSSNNINQNYIYDKRRDQFITPTFEDEPTDTFYSKNLNIFETSQGIFLAPNNKQGFKVLYFFDEDTTTYKTIKDSNGEDLTGSYNIITPSVYEDKYGTIWIRDDGSKGFVYVGNCVAESKTMPFFRNKMVFDLDGSECFISENKVYKFNGNEIDILIDNFYSDSKKYFSHLNKVFKQGENYYIFADLSSNTSTESTDKQITVVWNKEKGIISKDMSPAILNSLFQDKDERIFYWYNNKIYKIENDEITESSCPASSPTTLNFYNYNGYIYFIFTSGNYDSAVGAIYCLRDNETFELIKSFNRYCKPSTNYYYYDSILKNRESFVYFIQSFQNANTSLDNRPIEKYDPVTNLWETTEIIPRSKLGDIELLDFFLDISNYTVYNVKTGNLESISDETIKAYTSTGNFYLALSYNTSGDFTRAKFLYAY